MTSWIGAIFLVIGFIALIRRLGLVERSGQVVGVTRRSWDVIRNPAWNDHAKEQALQKAALQLLRLFLGLAFGGAAAVFLPVAVLWLLDRLGWLSLPSVFEVGLSPAFLIGSGVVTVLALMVPRPKKTATAQYSRMDRLLHRVAFVTFGAQASLADLEDRLFARQLNEYRPDRPVFVTALPRAGTTILLESLAKLPEFASHCYRDMPFVLIPCLWGRYSHRFQQQGVARERAHGDGMLINFDSPEAFEEILWKTLWPRHYCPDRIVPWPVQRNEEFAAFFRSHMCKIMYLRGAPPAPVGRYLSKNNLNIARLPLLQKLFPQAVIIVPFRHPCHHAASLLQQHRHFLTIHADDPFACAYMRAIGHFDFGKNLRPIDFDHWIDEYRPLEAESLDFWLRYWIVTYRHLLTLDHGVIWLSYEALCEDAEHELSCVAQAIGTTHGDMLLQAATKMRAPRERAIDMVSVSPSLVEEADDVYRQLQAASRDLALRRA